MSFPAEAGRYDAGPATTDNLEALRTKLDRIDESLLDSLRERIQCCVDIAKVKRQLGVPMMQPYRIGVVQQRAARYAADNGIDRDFMHCLYNLIIEETCRIEALVIADDTPVAGSPVTAVEH